MLVHCQAPVIFTMSLNSFTTTQVHSGSFLWLTNVPIWSLYEMSPQTSRANGVDSCVQECLLKPQRCLQVCLLFACKMV